jgi:hypothetical protein
MENPGMNANLSLPALPDELTRRDNTASLLDVAKRAKRALCPVTPTPEFRVRLRDGLRMAAHHHQAQVLLIRSRSHPHWGWLIGAAALGSAAGLAAIMLRSRQSHQASSRQATR